MLYVLYSVGFPLHYVIVFGVLALIMIFMRGKIYARIDSVASAKFEWFGKLPAWGKKLMVVAIFVITYTIIKQVAFWLLGLAGINVQQEIMDSIQKAGK
ncbi:MAG: hypothetical protein WC492_02665 [Candidatus Micrarchaeia archaeon]